MCCRSEHHFVFINRLQKKEASRRYNVNILVSVSFHKAPRQMLNWLVSVSWLSISHNLERVYWTHAGLLHHAEEQGSQMDPDAAFRMISTLWSLLQWEIQQLPLANFRLDLPRHTVNLETDAGPMDHVMLPPQQGDEQEEKRATASHMGLQQGRSHSSCSHLEDKQKVAHDGERTCAI